MNDEADATVARFLPNQRGGRRRPGVPTPDRRPLEAIPFADVVVTDNECRRIIEMMEEQGIDLYEAAETIGKPLLAIERALADYRFRWDDLLQSRATNL